ncbi:undecaprenyl-diphosphate phosphatase [Zooshikella marina]|uniref:undecaprenyl-diphosphate phosphatase n=1 Tax=Zooshikella ganghwensis TaxID=202772 RepID=UPI00040DA64F|nr:undecaprenyl-diphosphate phosphatase [Zooshikella ganghwensis]MBU2705752.1 undecaprenyl-diphosphate phosphatase [Zooshikella ganghwensis]
MDVIQAIILALIQGLTEFLPISSSAHLVLPAQLLGWPDQGLAFDVAVHIGTLIAVVLYFRDDLWAVMKGMLEGLFGKQKSFEGYLGWYIILGTIPAVLFGLAISLMDVENQLRSIFIIACTTLIFGVLLGWADRTGTQQRQLTEITWKQVLIIGIAQALAIIPGTSRSGVTITAGLMLGFTRNAAARFSFLLSIPVIFAAGLLKTKDLVMATEPVAWDAIFVGVFVAGISAYVCIHLFLSMIARMGMMPFVIYRVLLSAALFFVYFTSI